MLAIALSLLPVIAFLCALHALDTYKLLTLRRILIAIAAGIGAALLTFPVNTFLFRWLGVAFGEWLGPVAEELLKAIFPLWCIRSNRVGFPVDAGIIGFATVAGFSLIENLLYINSVPDGTPLLWLVRGLGTAVMHGTTTAIVAIFAITALDRRLRSIIATICGFLIAFAVHVFHNTELLTPVEMAAVMIMGAPVLLAAVFWKSEQTLARWLSTKLDRDIEMIDMIDSGTFLGSNAGRYLQSLSNSFRPEVVGDMLCLIRLSAQLSAQAKGNLLRQELGFEPEHDPELTAKLKEMQFLEQSVGRAGRMALAPLAPRRVRDLWEMYRLNQEPKTSRTRSCVPRRDSSRRLL
jgi:RsiW-degrading membrane proteinase PrsW (M82 family)